MGLYSMEEANVSRILLTGCGMFPNMLIRTTYEESDNCHVGVAPTIYRTIFLSVKKKDVRV